MFALAGHANELLGSLFERVRGELRPGADVHDLSMILELVAALKVSDRARTEQLRRRYLAVILDGMRSPECGELPGPAPSWRELNEPWVERDARS